MRHLIPSKRSYGPYGYWHFMKIKCHRLLQNVRIIDMTNDQLFALMTLDKNKYNCYDDFPFGTIHANMKLFIQLFRDKNYANR